jgi:hemerythrin-like domain-containing protein
MTDIFESQGSRRTFLVKGGMLIAAASLSGVACWRGSAQKRPAIPPTEDLMQEHGVLRRIMLVYDDLARRLKQGEDIPGHVLTEANDIIRRFGQDYHEKNEERYVFNRFAKAGKMVKMVAILSQQHLAGRKLLEKIKSQSSADNLKKLLERPRIAELLTSFNQLYRHHAAWEDTVLFPAFRSVTTPQDFAAVGETFAQEEDKLFGRDGYDKVVEQVAGLEKILGIHDLQQFTPKL